MGRPQVKAQWIPFLRTGIRGRGGGALANRNILWYNRYKSTRCCGMEVWDEYKAVGVRADREGRG